MAPQMSFSESIYAVAGELKRAKLYNKREAVGEGGLLTGVDPTAYDPSDPLRLWIIQLAIIMCTAQLLSLLLRKMKQPKVIAEVIGGIVLGPTLMGRIPGFTNHIFPADSMPFLSLVANIGLVLFLFLVGLEIDTESIKKNYKSSFCISVGGMILPFSIGVGMSKLIYKNFVVPVDPTTVFTDFMLFTCVAYSITAFPVLCRILSELKLFDTTVGICVLSAGVGNDIMGWTLLALSVALVNASSGLTALYIILIAIAWALVVCFPARKLFYYLALKTDSLSNPEPSLLFMSCTLIFVFASAFFTDVIGVHAIFGGFLAGLVVPRENGLTIKMTEKIEDLVGIVFLPLYFTISGLSTNLGLLNTGRIWGYAIAIIVTAWFGKFVGASAGAKICGFGWREAATIGELMSCKGLVELIVLNIGLQAGILSQLVFSMFVLEALTLTFFTTPGVVLLYPPHLRRRVTINPNGTSRTLETGPESNEKGKGLPRNSDPRESANSKGRWSNVTVVLDKLEHLPGLICVSELLRRSKDLGRTVTGAHASVSSENQSTDGQRNAENKLAYLNTLSATDTIENTLTRTSTNKEDLTRISTGKGSLPGYSVASPPSGTTHVPGMVIRALRLLELSDRTSAVMKSIRDNSALLLADPLVNIFKTIHELRGGFVRSIIKVEPVEEWANVIEETINDELTEYTDGEELIVTCWLGDGSTHGPAPANEDQTEGTSSHNPLDFLFNRSPPPQLSHSKSANATPLLPHSRETTTHAHFVRSLFAKSNADVALYVDNCFPAGSHLSRTDGHGGHNTILLPFFGGPDDRAALDMVIQLCKDSSVRGVIVRVTVGEHEGGENQTGDLLRPPAAFFPGTIQSTFESTIGGGNTVSQFPDTVYAPHTTATRLQNRTADEMYWEKYTSNSSPQQAPPNVEFTNIHSPSPLFALQTVAQTIQRQADSTGRLLIVIGRSRRLAVESHHAELAKLVKEPGHGHLSSEFRKMIGDVASALVVGGIGADMLVLQAGRAAANAGVEV